MMLWIDERRCGDLAQIWVHGEASAAEVPRLRAAAYDAVAVRQARVLLARCVGAGWPADDQPLGAYHGSDGAAAICLHAVRGGGWADDGVIRRWRTPAGELAATALTAEDADGACVAIAERLGWDTVQRTWWWLDGILDQYAEFNRVRSRHFTAAGLIRSDGGRVLPASTGIGLRPHGGRIRLEALAAPGQPPQALDLTARQAAASNYGSSFARAVRLPSPTGPLLLVSGTAAIDRAGATLHRGDALAQAHETVACLRAVLAAAGLPDTAVVGGLAYAVDAQAEAAWRAAAPPHWPVPVVRAVVCRPDLLVECELVAARACR
jgi:enamine deaminase RidA (YjgF/YER057c/UK114 family)